MPNPIIAIAGSAIGSTAAAVVGANKAAKAQNAATAASERTATNQIELAEKIFAQQREDQEPWRDAGVAALGEIQEGLASGRFSMDDWQFAADPGFEFRRQQGQDVIDKNAAAGGNFLSGQRIKDSIQFNQDFASNEYDRAFRREASNRAQDFNMLSGLAGGGQVANRDISNAAQNMGSSVSNALQFQGNAQARGAQNIGQIQQDMFGNIAGAGNQGISNYLTYSMLGAG